MPKVNKTTFSPKVTERYIKYRDFLRECLPLLDDPIPPSTDVPNWDKAVRNLDYYHPFREKAPSRVALLQSPLTPANILTRSGIFSLLIFRGILFNTQALRDGSPLVFPDLAAWRSFLEEDNREEAYYCNSAAYGATRSRSTSNAEAYWNGSEAIVEMVEAGTSFSELIRFIANQKSNNVTAYPGFGKLSAYLLVVDLVYAGVVDEPDIEEMADVVVWIGKGAVSQLVKLGARKRDIRQEFIDLYAFLTSDQGLTGAERDRMGFDVFVQEHGLCKRGRFYLHSER